MISRLIDTLRAAGLEPDARELEELLWLAPFLTPEPARDEAERSRDGSKDASEPPQSQEESSQVRRPETPVVHQPMRPSPPEAEVGMSRREPGVPTRHGGRLAFRSPGAPALPNPLQLGRALRPLRRRRDSHRLREFDEVATAERIAREGLWSPVFRPGRSRWLELELVVDTGRSMTIWKQTLAELRTFLRYVGIFRDVRAWSLTTDEPKGSVRLYRGTAGAAHGKSERNPRELMGTPGERRLILVVSDCVSPAWHSGGVGELLRLWGRSGPVAILQMLPQRVWVRTALRHHPAVWMHGREPGDSNARLVLGSRPGVVVPGQRGAVPVPTITLERESFLQWARVVAGRAGAWTPGVLMREGGAARKAPERIPEGLEPLEQVQRFESMASPLAQRLVQLLAAVPLSLPVMRLVERTRLPEAGQVHLAEVFLSGLLEEVGPPGGTGDPEQVQYDFRPGVREVLLASVPPAESIATLQSVSKYVEERLGQTLDFPAMLADPTKFGDEQLDESLKPFARVAAAVLRQLGGEYASLATRLEGLPPGQGHATRSRTEVPAEESPTQTERTETPPEERPATPRWQPSGKRVLVVGSRKSSRSEQLRRLCALLGQTLARKGHALVSEGWPGVDQEVGATYVETLRDLGVDPEWHVTQVVNKGRKPALDVGKIVSTKAGWRGSAASLEHADLVVMLKGREEVFQVVEVARILSKPVLPLPGTGGDAARAYNSVMGAPSFRWWSGLSRRSLLRLDVPVSTEAEVIHAVEVLSSLIDRLHLDEQLQPYASAMLQLVQSFEFGVPLETRLDRNPRWREFIEELEHAAGGVRPPLARLTLKPGDGEGASVTLGDPGPAIDALRATLPAMIERLLEDFERIGALEEYARFGCRVQSELVPLVLEFAGEEGLETVGEVLSQKSIPQERPFFGSLVEAVKERLDSPEEFEDWLSTHLGLSSAEFEFRKKFREVARRLRDTYDTVRGLGPEEVDSALSELLRESGMASIGYDDQSEFPWSYGLGLSPQGRRRRGFFNQMSSPLVDLINTTVRLPNPQFVEHFLSSERGFERAAAYLLIQQYLPELSTELVGSIARERSLMRTSPEGWWFAVNRLLSCLLYQHGELVSLDSWPEMRWKLVQFLDDLRNISIPREEAALMQLVERLSEVVFEMPVEQRVESPAEATSWQWSGKWIVVAGTGSDQLPEQLEQVCRVLGEGLAREGHGLVGGGWPGVDAVVAQAYVATLRSLGGEPKDSFLQIVEEGRSPELREGTIETVRPDKSLAAEVSMADAVILIGGLGGTARMLEAARFLGRPVLPLPATGGDAQAVYEHIRGDSAYLLEVGLSERAVSTMGGSISSEGELRHTIDGVLELIGRIHSVSTAYARALLMLLASEQPTLFGQRKPAIRPRWDEFLEQLARQAEVQLPETADDVPWFVADLMFGDTSELQMETVAELDTEARGKSIARTRLQSMLPRMGEKLLADFERVTELERPDALGYPIQVALAPLVARSQGEAGLKAIGRVMHRTFDGLPSPFITALLMEAQRHFPSEEHYRDWVTVHLGISPEEYEFRQTVYRLSLGLQLNLDAGVHIKGAMGSLREALPANEVARESAFIWFFLREERPALQRVLGYFLIEEFHFTSFLPELLRALPREHHRMNEPHSVVAVWQLLSCLGTSWGDPLLEEQWPQVSRELLALRETLEAQPRLDPYGELKALLDAFPIYAQPREKAAQQIEHLPPDDELRAREDVLAAHQSELPIAQRAAELDPGSPLKLRRVYLIHYSIGGVLRKKGDLDGSLSAYQSCLAVAQRMVERQPANGLFLRDLYLGHSSIGYILREKEELDEALAAYKSCLAIAQRMVEHNPDDPTPQRDLFLSYYRIGGVLRSLGNIDRALSAFESAVAVAWRAVERDPHNAMLKKDLSVSSQTADGVLRDLMRLP
ncbi:SAV_2336 N-terminal domain-related protein [Archangium violaceum]|uniref:SAV_2336 N-terminal domain-related protein n=1 Tax=Archangium violaceum TaxID=83451 RepID=UPI002B2AF83D|nr:SAV_2336 N-terminal domain-related protein [Archangium gephyra]